MLMYFLHKDYISTHFLMTASPNRRAVITEGATALAKHLVLGSAGGGISAYINAHLAAATDCLLYH